MTKMTKEEINKRLALSFYEKKQIVHVKRSGRDNEPLTIFRNGLISNVNDDFFVIIDEITGNEPIYYFEIKGYIEEYKPRGAI